MTGARDPAPEDPSTEDRLGPGRLLAFSDGVVAIALTLLVLPLAALVPDAVADRAPGSTLITEHLPQIGSFLLSFAVIGRFWMVHHEIFDRAHHATRALSNVNLLWLLTIVVLPFPTEMVGVYGGDPFTVRFYIGTLFLSSGVLSALRVMVESSRREPRRTVPRDLAGGTTSLMLLVALVVVLVRPEAGYYPLLLMLLAPVLERRVQVLTDRRG